VTAMSFETITLRIDEGVATLTLNRPDRMNALSVQLKSELAAALDELEKDPSLRALVVTGAGDKAFCAGADIKERSTTDPAPAQFISDQRATYALFSRIEGLACPVIAAINGVAFGGGLEIALCCDFRLAVESAKLGLTEVNLGVMPAGGGTQRLSRLVGAARAKQLIMTGRILDAASALRLGIIDDVIPTAEFQTRVRAFAADLAAKAPLALRFVKKVIDRGAQTDLAAALDQELYAASILFASEDRKEGMKAFVEKRKPVFRGR
jgi:enoyl-CoA hydratase